MIYLDNAATTYPKPESVLIGAVNAQNKCGGNPGRSSHSLSVAASEVIYNLRCSLCDFFSLENTENAVLTFNATYAINIAINALWQGGHILLSNLEHNSTVRPVAQRTKNYSFFNALSDNVIEDIEQKRQRNTRMLICTHKSNSIGHILPVEEISLYCKMHGIRMIIDASQSAGIDKIGFDRTVADAICIPSHKGLYGLQGMGAVLFNEKYDGNSLLHPLVSGGSGAMSRSRTMPRFLPERLEAGTLSVPIAAAWNEGIRFVKQIGIDKIASNEGKLSKRSIDYLNKINKITVYNQPKDYSSGIVLFSVSDYDSDAFAKELDKRGICVRSGLHCSPVSLDTVAAPKSGAVRASFGIFNTEKEVNIFLNAIEDILKI